MFLTRLQITLTLNKLAEYSCKLFPFGCLIIQYAFKEHGDERRKIPLSNITILARGSTLSVFKECLGRINLHKKEGALANPSCQNSNSTSRVDLQSDSLFIANANKTFWAERANESFLSWKATDEESTINKSAEEQRVSAFLPTKINQRLEED